MLTRLLLSLLLLVNPSDQFARLFISQPFAVTYTGTTAGVWKPTAAGTQLPFTTAGGSWSLTVNKTATITLYTSAAGGAGGIGGISLSGGGGGGGAYNSGGISVTLSPGNTYSYVVGAFPNGTTYFANSTTATNISYLTGGADGGSGPSTGGAGGTVVVGAGSAGGPGGSGGSGTFCLGGGMDGSNAGGPGGGGAGGFGNDSGTGAGCGGGGVSNPAPVDGYTGASGSYGIAATICGNNIGGGGGGGGEGSSFGGAGGDNRFYYSGQSGIVCLQLVSIP